MTAQNETGVEILTDKVCKTVHQSEKGSLVCD